MHVRTFFWGGGCIYSHTDNITKPPSTVAGCGKEAWSPVVSLNINGLPDRSGEGREKTRQIAGVKHDFCVELLKYDTNQNANN